MRVWLINPYGPIPGEGWRDYRFTLAARALAARGHDVTWFTAAFDHHTKRTRTSAPRGIELIETPAYSSNISLSRLRFERTFARNVARISHPKPDIIIAADPPQSCGAAGRTLAARFGVPLVLDCLDLWPELFIRVAPRAIRPFVRAAVQPMFAARRKNVRAAALVIAVADAYRDVLAREGARRAITIPIGVDVAAFDAPRREHDRFTLVYAGSLGEHYDLATLFAAVDGLDVDLIVAGQGSVKVPSLPNVRFAGVIAPGNLPALYAQADAGVAPYDAASTVAMPLKYFDYLAAGLPVISSLPLEGAVRYEAGNVASLRAAIAEARSSRRSVSRELARKFDIRPLYEQYADAIEEVAR